MKATRPVPAQQNNATAVQRVLDNNGEELLWVAEVMTGNRQAGEQSLSEAVALAKAAQYVGQEWMLSWMQRLLVHVALRRISEQIRELSPRIGGQRDMALARVPARTYDRLRLRSIPPQRIIASLNVLERCCFILYAYFEYPVLDCALLLGCPRAWIESICTHVLTDVSSLNTRHGSRNVNVIISSGDTECAG